MAKRVPSYFEPWRAEVTADWKKSWGEEPPPVDDPDVIERWRSGKAKAEEDAEWVVWGTGMFEPGVVWGYLDGQPKVSGGEHVVARFRKIHTDKEGAVRHGEIARRIAECVNACAGVPNPVALIAATRDLLFALADGTADASDPRVVSLLARWIPATPNNAVVGPESNTT